MATGYDEYFGFDLVQRKTLAKLLEQFTTDATAIANLNAWATATATKLNADAGVTDTDYDTDPQA